MSTTDELQSAVLMVGPTGSGKTPVGQMLEERGLWGRRCAHFDFGENLRACASGAHGNADLTEDEGAFLRRVIDEGALLEDEQFPIARKILAAFCASHGVDARTTVLLNGLPRHVGQADDMARVVRMTAVVCLACDAASVDARIRGNVGGDRTGRDDDAEALVRRKLETYTARTEPLMSYYRERGVPVIDVCIDARTTPQAAVDAIESKRPDVG